MSRHEDGTWSTRVREVQHDGTAEMVKECRQEQKKGEKGTWEELCLEAD